MGGKLVQFVTASERDVAFVPKSVVRLGARLLGGFSQKFLDCQKRDDCSHSIRELAAGMELIVLAQTPLRKKGHLVATQFHSFVRSRSTTFIRWGVTYQPITMLDSIALRACSRSVPVSCMYSRIAWTLSPADFDRQSRATTHGSA